MPKNSRRDLSFWRIIVWMMNKSPTGSAFITSFRSKASLCCVCDNPERVKLPVATGSPIQSKDEMPSEVERHACSNGGGITRHWSRLGTKPQKEVREIYATEWPLRYGNREQMAKEKPSETRSETAVRTVQSLYPKKSVTLKTRSGAPNSGRAGRFWCFWCSFQSCRMALATALRHWGPRLAPVAECIASSRENTAIWMEGCRHRIGVELSPVQGCLELARPAYQS